MKATRAAEQGVGWSPHTSARPSDRHVAGWLRVSRRCRADRGRRATDRGPFFQLGPRGPSTSITVTVPCPSSSLSRRTTVGASSRSWVAQAVESVRTTSRPSSNDSGVQWAATSSPTSSAQRAKTPCTRRSRSQPWSATSRPTVVSRICGSRSSGWAPGRLRPRTGRLGSVAALAGPASPGPSRADGPGQRAGQVEAVVAWSGSAGCRRPVGGQVPGSSRRRLRHPHGPPPATRRRTGPRPAPSGTSAATAAVTSTCSAPATSVGELLAALGVELGEHVVEDQDRVVAVGAQQVVRRQPQRERERPRLPVDCVALHRQPGVAGAERQHQVVAVRADQRDAAVELVVAAPLELGQQRPRPARARSRAGRRSRRASKDGL